MVTLHASAKLEHIYRSLRDYMQTHLGTTEGLMVHDHGVLEFNVTSFARWVSWSPALLSVSRGSTGPIDGTYEADWVTGFLDLTLAERVSQRTNIFAFAALRDQVMPYFVNGTTIPIYDYDTGGNPEVGGLFLGKPTGRITDTGDISGIAQYSISCPVMRLEMRIM